MRIEAVTVCMNYGDFLAHSMPLNKNHFDDWIIVTLPEDTHTQDVCNYYRTKYITTYAADLHKGEFHKGLCVTEGLKHLSKADWLLLIDADTILQPNFRDAIEILNFEGGLDPSCLYTIDRIRFETYEEWMKFYGRPSKYNLYGKNTDGRFCLPDFIPTGFFQMWHSSTGIVEYIHQWVKCGGEDIRFSYLWPRGKRVFIPETTCYHIASSPENNWLGRKSKPFQIDR